jgi:hypothetical protein
MPGGKGNIRPEDNPKPFNKNPENIGKGRKKKIYNVIKSMGYSADDIRTAFGELAFYSLKELKKIHDDESKPIITRIIANQFFLALKKGDWTKIREILEHVVGKPQAIIGINQKTEISVNEETIKKIDKALDNNV